MEDQDRKLFNKDFTLVVIGQIISLFGNAIIRLALPLYLLDITGSAALYGITLACSMIPMILLSPIGGIIADRVNKRNVMVILDFSTATLLVLFSMVVRSLSAVPVIIATMMILFGIQALYQPTVQGSMPLLSSSKNLLTSNSIINQVSALSGLIGPAIGGTIYGMAGIWPIIGIGAVCFTLSAIMEIFITMPYVKQAKTGSMLYIAKEDFSEGMHFALKQKPVIVKVALICAAFNLALSAMMMVGMPTIIKINLALSSNLYGYAQASVGAGGLIGGLCVGILGKKMSIEKSYKSLTAASLAILPTSLILFLDVNPIVIYCIMLLSCTACMVLTTIFSIQALTYIQEETPIHLVGKVIACVMAICMCSQPIGQLLYGFLFEKFYDQPQWIILGAVIVCTIISVMSKGVFIKIEHTEKEFESTSVVMPQGAAE